MVIYTVRERRTYDKRFDFRHSTHVIGVDVDIGAARLGNQVETGNPFEIRRPANHVPLPGQTKYRNVQICSRNFQVIIVRIFSPTKTESSP